MPNQEERLEVIAILQNARTLTTEQLSDLYELIGITLYIRHELTIEEEEEEKENSN